MIEPFKPTHVLYHDDLDGFASAWVIWRKYGDDPKYIPVNYGQPMPDIPNHSSVMIVDFSYPRDELEALAERVDDLVVIDHHKSAMKELIGLEFCIFDRNHSGCMLTWDFIFPGDSAPRMISFIEDRDMWWFRLDNTRPFVRYVNTVDRKFKVWNWVFRHEYEAVVVGRHMDQYNDWEVQEAAKRFWYIIIDCYQIPCVTVPYWLVSDVCHLMLEKHPDAIAAAGISLRSDGKFEVSLRSKKEDVSRLAKLYGGGGHKLAAGFTCSPKELGAMICSSPTPKT